MNFTVETLQFEGPLDLMLHLISEQQLDIFDLNMEVLTDQYIAYLNAMSELKIDVESEYLVELATLIEYKSKKLLPKKQDELEDNYEEDPRDRLVKRLLEYQQYKEVSATLYDAYLERDSQYAKTTSYESFIKENNKNFDDVSYEGNPYDLLKAMERVLRRAQLAKPIETKFTEKELSMEDRILQIKSRFINLPPKFSFTNICDDCTEIHQYIVTFLAILDMAKNHYLVFTIDDNDEIWFERGTNND